MPLFWSDRNVRRQGAGTGADGPSLGTITGALAPEGGISERPDTSRTGDWKEALLPITG